MSETVPYYGSIWAHLKTGQSYMAQEKDKAHLGPTKTGFLNMYNVCQA